MNIENIEVYGFKNAIRGMRNPMNSWNKADTFFALNGMPYEAPPGSLTPRLGKNDSKLAAKLIRSGTDHRKFLRQIFITFDIAIPRYVWQELDTFKVATVRNSCSTMHKLGHADLTLDDFQDGEVFPEVLQRLNHAGFCYREKRPFDAGQYGHHDPDAAAHETRVLEGYDIVRWMKKHMPEGYLQLATYTMSYETALAILRSRGNHRLTEWSGPGGICETIRGLPLMSEFEKANSK